MAISVNYSATPWLITIPKSDLALDSGTKYKLDVDVFWQLLRDYADSSEGIVNPVIYARIAATASTPSITEINADYFSLQFEDGLYSVNVINGNTNIRDVEVKNQVSVNTNNTTGFIDPVFLEINTFDSVVSVDETNGTAGTGYPIGTPSSPSNNWTDAHAIAGARGIRAYRLYGSSVLTGTHDFSEGHIFSGFSPVTSAMTIDTSVDVSSCEFTGLQMSGVLDGNSVFRECVVGTVNYVNGFIYNSALAGTITLGGSANASVQGCWQQTQSTPVTVDMGGSGQQLAMSDYNGDVTLSNCTGEGKTYISGRGHVTLDSTLSSGTFTIYGDMTYTNNMTGTAVLVDRTSSELTWDNKKALTIDNYIGLS